MHATTLANQLTLHDVFPHANADWDVIDAPCPSLVAWQTGADADINTLETEMDSAEVRLTTVETEMDAAEVRLTTGETSATDHGGRITVLEGAGGAVDPHRIDIDPQSDDSNWLQLTADQTVIFYSRNRGSSGGSSVYYQLPATADVEDGHMITINCYNKVHVTQNGGTIFLKLNDPNTQAWGGTSFHHDRIHTMSGDMYFNEIHRSTFTLTLNKTSDVSIATWYARCVSDSHVLYNIESELATNTTQIATSTRKTIFFSNTESAYRVDNSNFDAYQLPSNIMDILVLYGDGTLDANSTFNPSGGPGGVRVRLPVTPPDGCVCTLVTLHSFVSQSAWDVLFVRWDSVGISGSRKLIELNTAILASVGDNRIETMCTNQKRRAKIFTFNDTDDVWYVREGSY
jgi:hypothetical protein